MGRSKMSSLKITLLPLAICLLLSLNSQVSGKPSPKHLLIETKEKAKKNNDYDYTLDVTNVGGKIGGIGDGSWNHGDYAISDSYIACSNPGSRFCDRHLGGSFG